MKHVLKLTCALLATALWAVAATAQNPSGTAPGMAAPHTGIYKCQGCGSEVVSVAGDPLRDITAATRNVRWVMKGGKVVVDRTR